MKTLFLYILTGFYTLFFLGTGVPMVWGQSAETGGMVDPFELGASARVLAMGDAGVALAGDGGAALLNPALLATVNQNDLLMFHAPLFIDTLYDSVGFVQPLTGSSGFALSLSRLGIDNILQTQNNIVAVSTFSTQEWEATLSLGAEVVPGLGMGIQMKGIQEQISLYQGEGVGMDAGLIYRFAQSESDYSKIGLPNLVLGIAAVNLISPQITLYQTGSQPSEIIKPSVGFLYDISPHGDRLWLAMEGEMTQGGSNLVKAGAEYTFQGNFSLRAGFDGVSPTAGGGVSLSGFELDYAYNQRDLGTLNRLSLSYRFGEYIDPVQAQKREMLNERLSLLKWVAQSYEKDEDYDAAIKAWNNVLKEYPDDAESSKSIQSLKDRRHQQVEALMKQARPAMQKGDYVRGIPILGKVLALEPGNTEARNMLKHVDQGRQLETAYLAGVEAYRHENYREAMDYLEGVYDTNPDYRDVALLYRDVQSRIQPLESLPKDLSDLYAKGVDAYMKGQYSGAISLWQQVLAKDPRNRLVARNLEEARGHLADPTPTTQVKSAP